MRSYRTGEFNCVPLTGQDLRGKDLTGTNFTNTNLTRANLAGIRFDRYRPTLTGVFLTDANLTGANLGGLSMKGATLTGATLAGADFTRTDLTSAVLAGVVASDLKLAYANLSFADLRNVKLTNANLAYANLSFADLRNATLTNANLTNAILVGANAVKADLVGSDLSSAKLSDADFAYAKLRLTNWTGADAARVNFTEAVISEAMLAKTDLTGANLSSANLLLSNLITATLTDVVWNAEVLCPRGGFGGPCSPFATEPKGDQYKSDGLNWYQYRSPATTLLPSTPLAGTPNTPLAWAGQEKTSGGDGIQGNITNLTGQRIVVRNVSQSTKPVPVTNEAILEPNAVMPYRLAPGGTLYFFKAPEGTPVGLAPGLYIVDGYGLVLGPTTRFYPPGWTSPVNERGDWIPKESHEEIWGSVNLWAQRELDGWKLPASQEYIRRYGDPNTSADTSDWPIMTIEVRSL